MEGQTSRGNFLEDVPAKISPSSIKSISSSTLRQTREAFTYPPDLTELLSCVYALDGKFNFFLSVSRNSQMRKMMVIWDC